MTINPPVEVRRNDDGSIDEIVAKNCSVQIEQMSCSQWYLEIVGLDGYLWQFFIGAKNGRSHVELLHDDTSPPEPTRIEALCALLRLHKCICRDDKTVGECVSEELCRCSCGLLIQEPRP